MGLLTTAGRKGPKNALGGRRKMKYRSRGGLSRIYTSRSCAGAIKAGAEKARRAASRTQKGGVGAHRYKEGSR